MHSNTKSHRYISIVASAVFLVAFMTAMFVGPSAAFAVKECRRVAPGALSMWTKRDSPFTLQCLTLVSGGSNGFVLIEGATGLLDGHYECVRVAPGEPSLYTDNMCTIDKHGTGEFTLVAALPIFLTLSGKTLLFSATGGVAVLRGKKLGQEAEIRCEKSSTHGLTLNESPLVHEVLIEFSGKCLENAEALHLKEAACTEPIKVKEAEGELGETTLGSEKELVGLLLVPRSGTEFVTTECGGSKTQVSGAIIGVFTEKSKYNQFETEAELGFFATGAKQEPTAIELLGSNMTGVTLKVSEFFGEEASEATKATVKGDGKVEILTP